MSTHRLPIDKPTALPEGDGHPQAGTISLGEPAEGDWFVEHDDRRSFVWPYIGLSIALSIFVGLFWLGVLAGVHFAVEFIRHRRLGARHPFLGSLWETKLDLGLLLLSVAMAIYMDLAFGVLGLRAVARGGLLQRGARAFFLLLDDIVRVVGTYFVTRGIGKSRERAAKEATEPQVDIHAPWASPWGIEGWISVLLIFASLLLLGIAPWLSGHTFTEALDIVLEEFHPFSM